MGAIALKVAVQMATKMGAEPWSVPIPATGVMVVGYDSYHDTADKSKSIGCIISTINQRLTRYNRQERDQNKGQVFFNILSFVLQSDVRPQTRGGGEQLLRDRDDQGPEGLL